MKLPLTIAAVGRLFGKALPAPGSRCKCPIRDHARQDKTFRVYRAERSGSGDEIWKCWSCDAPDNVGDAIALYQHLGGVARRDAWTALRDQGYDVPGLKEDFQPGAARPRPAPRPEKPRVPVRGHRPKHVLPLDPATLARWQSRQTGLVEKFAAQRGLQAATLQEAGVVEVDARFLGFVYTDPATGLACRCKLRGVAEKSFFVLPRDKNDSSRKPLAPLYLAHRLRPRRLSSVEPVIITEGEVDALTLVEAGLPNVVSLPDGSESVKTIDLDPLFGTYNLWICSFDADKAGVECFKTMRERASAAGADAMLLHWQKLVTTETGEELVTYKDANDAWQHGMRREDFVRCLDVAIEVRFGFTVSWDLPASDVAEPLDASPERVESDSR